MENLKADLITKSKLPLETSTDCKKLSTQIFHKTNEYVSTQTLRRILGLVKTDTKPTIKTLDILSRYMGFDSYNSYIISNSKSNTSEKKNIELLRLLYLTPIQNSHKESQSPLFRTLSKFIYDSPSNLSLFEDDVIFTENFKFYFIEKFPPFDLYFKGLETILHKLQEYYKNDIWFCFFVDSFYFLNALIEFSDDNLRTSFNALKNLSLKNIHPFLIGRFFGAKIALTNSSSQREKYHHDLIQFIIEEQNHADKFCILFTYTEFLIHQKLFSWAEGLIKLHYKSDEKHHNWLDYGYKEVIKIFLHLCLVENNKKNEAKEIQQYIEINAIPFYFREYYSSMYHKYYLG